MDNVKFVRVLLRSQSQQKIPAIFRNSNDKPGGPALCLQNEPIGKENVVHGETKRDTQHPGNDQRDTGCVNRKMGVDVPDPSPFYLHGQVDGFAKVKKGSEPVAPRFAPSRQNKEQSTDVSEGTSKDKVQVSCQKRQPGDRKSINSAIYQAL